MGLICGFGGNYAIRDWEMCQGQLLAVSENTALFSILGTYYGGNGQTTFGLPELRGRAPIGYGQSPGTSSYPIGQRLGAEYTVLTIGQMPSHTHTAIVSSSSVNVTGHVSIKASNAAGTTNNPVGGYMAAPPNVNSGKTSDVIPYTTVAPTGAMAADSAVFAGSGSLAAGAVTIGNNGNSQPFSLMQPISVINWLICVQGLYPSRN